MTRTNTIHTLESLRAWTTEEGDCLLWGKYLGNGVPMVYHDGKFIQVRKLVLRLSGVPPLGCYTAARCGNPTCVELTHIVQRTAKQHHSHMGKQVSLAPTNQMRIAKITKARRASVGKINQEQAIEIRMSEESGPVLAERYGVTRTMIARIKSGKSWAQDFGNPFAGLFTGLAANDTGRKRA